MRIKQQHSNTFMKYNEESFAMKKYNEKHTCTWTTKNKEATYQWLVKYFVEKVREDMIWKVMKMMREVNVQFRIIVSKLTC